jgi:hypothetical protein
MSTPEGEGLSADAIQDEMRRVEASFEADEAVASLIARLVGFEGDLDPVLYQEAARAARTARATAGDFSPMSIAVAGIRCGVTLALAARNVATAP